MSPRVVVFRSGGLCNDSCVPGQKGGLRDVWCSRQCPPDSRNTSTDERENGGTHSVGETESLCIKKEILIKFSLSRSRSGRPGTLDVTTNSQ